MVSGCRGQVDVGGGLVPSPEAYRIPVVPGHREATGVPRYGELLGLGRNSWGDRAAPSRTLWRGKYVSG